MVQLTSILKYPGGKHWLLPVLKPHWDRLAYPTTRLVEPFVGGMSIALGLNPVSALLGDVNPHLIDLYRSVASGGFSSDWYISRLNDKDVYYAYRKAFNRLAAVANPKSLDLRSQLLYYLNRQCFNGLMRCNLKGEFNTPFGKYKQVKWLTHQDFDLYAQRFATWEFHCGDFEQLELRPDDFLYLDPPYDSIDDKGFTGYFGKFGWEDRVRLAHWAAAHPGPAFLSDLATPRAVELYTDLGFEIEVVSGLRRLAANGNRDPVDEIFAYRNN
jgi:DNA adenine methylase